MDEIARRQNFVLRLLPKAGKTALGFFRSPALVIDLKTVQDPVTEADRRVERLFLEGISKAFPGDGFLGEEGGSVGDLGEDNFVWVIDPIDGTANFVRGIPHWCISVALVHRNEVELGFVYDPVNRETFMARRNAGAWLNRNRITTRENTELTRARVNVGFSYRRPSSIHLRGVETLLEHKCEYSRLASGALGMAWVACGRFDGYWEPHINAWDVLAGVALVKEAGGWVSDFLAGDGFRTGNPILASTPGTASELRRLLEPLNEESDRWAREHHGLVERP